MPTDHAFAPLALLLADAVLVVHLGIVVFVVGGLVAIVAGNLRGWAWVNAGWFRLAHVAAIGVVVAESWLGITCPLTTLESWLREQAGAAGYRQGFIADGLQAVLFHEAPAWVFTVAYSLFGLLVALAWWYFPPHHERTTSPDPLRRRRRARRHPRVLEADRGAGPPAGRVGRGG